MQLTAQSRAASAGKASQGRKGEDRMPPGRQWDLRGPPACRTAQRLIPALLPSPAACGPSRPRSVAVRAQAAGSDAEGTSRRATLLGSAAALSAAAAAPQLVLPRAARANTVLSADWEQVRMQRAAAASRSHLPAASMHAAGRRMRRRGPRPLVVRGGALARARALPAARRKGAPDAQPPRAQCPQLHVTCR